MQLLIITLTHHDIGCFISKLAIFLLCCQQFRVAHSFTHLFDVENRRFALFVYFFSAYSFRCWISIWNGGTLRLFSLTTGCHWIILKSLIALGFRQIGQTLILIIFHHLVKIWLCLENILSTTHFVSGISTCFSLILVFWVLEIVRNTFAPIRKLGSTLFDVI